MTLLRALLLGSLVVTGCGGDDSNEDYPIAPGGGGDVTGGSDDGTPIDAFVPDSDGDPDGALPTITGRVCAMDTLRHAFSTGSCASMGLDGTTVELDGNMTTTSVSGAFLIDGTTNQDALWHVTDDGLAPTVMRRSMSNTLFAISGDVYEDTATLYGVEGLTPGQGGIVVRLVKGTTPVAGATVTSNLQTSMTTLYDSVIGAAPDEDEVWEPGTTSVDGLAWIPTTGLGANTLLITEVDSDVSSAVVPVESGAITFHQISLP